MNVYFKIYCQLLQTSPMVLQMHYFDNKNSVINIINYTILNQIGCDSVSQKLIDNVMNAGQILNYRIKILNLFNIYGLSPHKLSLKIGAAIILLLNINPPRFCNGTTRLAANYLIPNIIEAKILNVNINGEDVLIPSITIIWITGI